MTSITEPTLARLRSCVETRLGLCIRASDRESFRQTLLIRMKSVSVRTPEEYLHLLEAESRAGDQEWRALVILLTTGESYFFRDKGHFALLQKTILPELLKNKEQQRSLRIWSAGCATGEEPYSLAILLDLLLPARQDWDIFILGTDLNEDSLRKAERGLYSPWSFRLMDKDLQEKYFKCHQGEWQLAEKIRKMVHFQWGNLLETRSFTQYSEAGGMDLIICRNVFIYFNSKAVGLAVARLSTMLNDSGYLITGHGELQGQNLTNLRQILYPEAVIYQKTSLPLGQAREVTRIPKQHPGENRRPVHGKPVVKSAPPLPLAVRAAALGDPRAEIEECIRNGRYAEAETRLEQFLPTGMARHDTICLLANAYANSGDYGKAADACREALNINADSTEPYLLLAHIAEAQGNDTEAKSLLRKALYLDPAFVAAYCELGAMYAKENDLPRAEKLRATAIALLKSLPGQARVRPYEISAGELLTYLVGQSDSVKWP